MNRKALIFGVGGQDGSYLADILLDKGWEVHGLHRASSADNLHRLTHLKDKITLHQGDITDSSCLSRIIRDVYPRVVFNEADQDHVGWSFSAAEHQADVTFKAVLSLLEAVRSVRYINPALQVFQPCSATMFGDAAPPQNENTPLNPMSPYAVCKAAAYHAARFYRRVHGMFVSTAILYNHDSPRRKEDYLLNRICRQVLRVKQGKQSHVLMGGDLTLTRHNVGHAREYMEAVVKQMELQQPVDLIICNDGKLTIHQIVEIACQVAGMEHKGVLKQCEWEQPPGPKQQLFGDSSKMKRLLGCHLSNTEEVVKRIMTEMMEGV
jgi:GDPmannose 4,6-dehydratase